MYKHRVSAYASITVMGIQLHNIALFNELRYEYNMAVRKHRWFLQKKGQMEFVKEFYTYNGLLK